MSEHIEHNLSRDLLARVQANKMKEEGYTRQPCGACQGTGRVTFEGRERKCPSCVGAGYKYRPSPVARGVR